MAVVIAKNFVESTHGFIKLSKNGVESSLSGHDVVDDTARFISAVAECEASFILGQGLFKIMTLKLFGCLSAKKNYPIELLLQNTHYDFYL